MLQGGRRRRSGGYANWWQRSRWKFRQVYSPVNLETLY